MLNFILQCKQIDRFYNFLSKQGVAKPLCRFKSGREDFYKCPVFSDRHFPCQIPGYANAM
jgi:hypothetical protein